MGKHHTEDYKLSAVRHALRTENQVETCRVFDCKRSSLQDWIDLYEKTGSPVRTTRKQRTAYKVSKEHITECCRELKITRTYLYERMKLKGVDIKIITNIQKEIEELLKVKVPV
jgi:transposase-like protein